MKTLVKTFRHGWDTRQAWWYLATARTQERFARTSLGSFWLGLSTLLSISVLAVVYGAVFKVQNAAAYTVYLGSGLVVWNTISDAMQSAPRLLHANAANIKNTNIHPIFYSLAEWAFQVQTFSQCFGLVLLALMAIQPNILWHLLSAGVLPMLNLLLFIYWAPLLICLLGAHYEDFFQVVPIVMQVMFLLSPILYAKEALGSVGWIADVNPFYRVLSNLRHALIHGEVKLSQVLIMLLINILGVICSVWVLERQRRHIPFLV